ncbi:unnamed protein product [Orchesella dallaii]|uniref:Transmembrane protein n=1 Tax=Orchesella dallaii TaxID=48710 RepID=A0ABP1RAW5_9HEXA
MISPGTVAYLESVKARSERKLSKASVMESDIKTMKRLGLVYLINVAFRSTVIIAPDMVLAVKALVFGNNENEVTTIMKVWLHPLLLFIFNLFELHLGIKFVTFHGSRRHLRKRLSDMSIWINFNVAFTFFYAVQSFIEKNWVLMLVELILRCFTFSYVLGYVDDLRLSFLVNPYRPRQIEDDDDANDDVEDFEMRQM